MTQPIASASQSIGKKIKSCREQADLTQSDLAERLSVTRQAVSNWERDKALPDIYALQQMAEAFGKTLDELMEGAKKPEVTMPKAPGYLLIATCAAILFQAIAGGIAGNVTGEMAAELIILDVVIGIFIQLFLHLYFSSAIKSGNLSMIAGFDSKVEYRMDEVKKVMVQIDVHVGCISFGTALLMGVCLFLEGKVREDVAVGLIFVYCLDLFVALMLINYRSLEKTLVKEQDQKVAKAGYISLCWFAAGVMLFVALTLLRFEQRQIQNNSPQALGWMGWMSLFLASALTGLFYEQNRVKKMAGALMEKDGRYRPGKCFLACAMLSAIFTLGMFFG